MVNQNALFTLNGEIVEASKAQGSFLCPPFMFGYGILDRLRFFWTPGGLICPGLRLHLARTLGTVRLFFPGAEAPSSARLLQWMTDAVCESRVRDNVYLHLGIGPYDGTGTMLQGAFGALDTFIFVKEEGPLYGTQGLYVSSETEYPRPDGPLAAHKTHGPYAELLMLKGRARARLPRSAPAPGKPDPREALLFARQSFRFDAERNCSVLAESDPLVAECGCANAFALDCNGNLHLPARGTRFFHGTKVRIVEALFRAYFPDRDVLYDLRRNHLRFNGGVVGTATKELVPVVELDHEPTERTELFEALSGLYRALCRGELNRRDLQEGLAPVVLTTQGQRVAIA